LNVFIVSLLLPSIKTGSLSNKASDTIQNVSFFCLFVLTLQSNTTVLQIDRI